MNLPRTFKLSSGDIIDLNHVIEVGEVEDGSYNVYETHDTADVKKIIGVCHKFLFQFVQSTNHTRSEIFTHYQTIDTEPSYDMTLLKQEATIARNNFIRAWSGGLENG